MPGLRCMIFIRMGHAETGNQHKQNSERARNGS